MSTGDTKKRTRATSERKKIWKPPNKLDFPPAPPGVHYRWVRYSTRGEADDGNVYSRKRQHYEVVRPEELAGFEVDVMDGGKYPGVVRCGDLILMKTDQEVVDQRNEYFRNLTKTQNRAIRRELLKEQNPNMPITIESKEEVYTPNRGKTTIQEDEET